MSVQVIWRSGTKGWIHVNLNLLLLDIWKSSYGYAGNVTNKNLNLENERKEKVDLFSFTSLS